MKLAEIPTGVMIRRPSWRPKTYMIIVEHPTATRIGLALMYLNGVARKTIDLSCYKTTTDFIQMPVVDFNQLDSMLRGSI